MKKQFSSPYTRNLDTTERLERIELKLDEILRLLNDQKSS